MKKSAFLMSLIGASVLFPAVVMASPSVIINGYDVTGIYNQKFENVTVSFDANGNINITAPQYKIADPAPQPKKSSGITVVSVPSGGAGTNSGTNSAPANTVVPVQHSAKGVPVAYDRNALPDIVEPTYLVAQFSEPGLLGYDVDVFINGQFIKEMKQGVEQQTMDVSRFIVKGVNSIQYRLVPVADSGQSSTAYVELMFSKLSGKQGTSLELVGQYGLVKIMGKDGQNAYSVELKAP